MNKKLSFALLFMLIFCLLAIIYLKTSAELEGATAQSPAPSPSPVTETEPPIQSALPSIAPSAPPSIEPSAPPTPSYPDIDITSWEYVLVNSDSMIDASFAPELTALENGHYFDSRAVAALQEFIAAARAEGLSVYLTSSYRAYGTQEYLFNNKLAQYGGDYAAAARIVAVPGSSEHQTGLAADIVDKYYQYMNESLADTELSKWMYENCAQYGFILRFPEDKQDITKIMFEPWHFRYVGVEAATYIMENGLCLEEFVALYK